VNSEALLISATRQLHGRLQIRLGNVLTPTILASSSTLSFSESSLMEVKVLPLFRIYIPGNASRPVLQPVANGQY